MGIGKATEDAIDELLSAFVTEKVALLCTALAPLALTAITIYILRQGFALAAGRSNSTFEIFVEKSMRISFITAVSLNLGIYQIVIVGGIDGLETSLTMTLSGATSVGALVDGMAMPFAELGQKLWSDATTGLWPMFGLLGAAALVAIAQVALFTIGLGLYLVAKVALVLVTALGPLYLLCATNQGTEKYTESWLGQVLNYIVLKVLIALNVAMLAGIVSKFAEHIHANIDDLNVVMAVVALGSCCGALLIVMLNVPQIASALAGGASISGIGRTVARFMLDYLHSPSHKKPATLKPPVSSIENSSPRGNSARAPATPLYQRNTMSRLHSFA